MSEIRELVPEEYTEYMQLTAEAYPGIGIATPEDIGRAVGRLKIKIQDPRMAVYGAFRSAEMVGIMALYDYTMNVHGVPMLAGGVGNIAVHLAHKKEHVAKDLMEFYLDLYRQRKAPMAVLWPFRPNFYRRMGFGLASKVHQYRVAA
ncbi:MAG: GNAT family N-acetyltransferase, partial [candidate division Zixibacteria bacterium]|nr:GNAT family N-acetyltransferase [candidate division Zixibacteria bacterium]